MFNLRPAHTVSILSYHNISRNGAARKGVRKDTVRIADFERQMRCLKEKGFQVCPLSEVVSRIASGRSIGHKTVVITFDDGYESTYRLAYPVLQLHGFPFSVFLATDFIDTLSFPWLPSTAEDNAPPMRWEEVAALDGQGVEIGSHTAAHRFLPGMATGEMEKDLMRSSEVIGERVGHRPANFAVPFSFPLTHRQWPLFKRQLTSALNKARFSSCCTLCRGRIKAGEEVVFLPRAPVMRDDTLWSFYAKALGLYAYTGLPQVVYQNFFKKYDYGAEEIRTKEVG